MVSQYIYGELFKMMARRDPVGVRLLDPTRDMSGRFCYDARP